MTEPLPEFPPDAPVQKTYGEALRGMVDRPFLNSQKWQEQQWRANREGAHPAILDFEPAFLRRVGKLGIPMFAHAVVRTEEEQRKAFLDGHSNDSPEDGIWPHRGTAIDLIHGTKAWGLSKRQWALIGHIGKEVARQRGLKLTWGGDFKPIIDGVGWDPAHWEVTGFKAIAGEYPWTPNN